MTAVVSWQTDRFNLEAGAGHPVRQVVEPEGVALINRLRLVGLRCRAARKAPPIEACRLIAEDDGGAPPALEMLMRSLPQALGRAPVLFAPGTAELSFDEAWLLQLIAALRAGDVSSVAFLLRSRVALHARRGLVFLMNAALFWGLRTF